jgi:hypothetical protein
MAPRERERSERLNRFWDDMSAGEAADSGGLDGELVETVRQLHTLHRPPAIDPAFQRRLGEQLLGAPAVSGGGTQLRALHPTDRRTPPALNGHIPTRAWGAASERPTRRHWSAAPLAAAAALVLVVLGAFLALRIGLPRANTALNVLEAIHPPAVETLVDATVENSSPNWTPLEVGRWNFPPGAATLSIPPLDGPQWIVAEGAGLTISTGGVERALTPGAGIVVAAGQDVVVRNRGDAAVTALRGVANSGFALEEYDRAVISKAAALDTEAHPALPPRSSRIVFEQITLEPRTTLLLEPASGQDWVDVSTGRLGLTLVGNGLPLHWQSGREREVAADELLPALAPGTRVTLRNVGEEPLVLLRLRVLPAAAGEQPGAIATASD